MEPALQFEPRVLAVRALCHFADIRSNPDETDAIQSARVRAARHLLHDETDQGIELLLATMQRNARFAREQGRKDLLEAFHLAPADAPSVINARRKLASLIH
ncbi:MAG: tetratricopeptide repeat protein [Steroidobacteraceae bacterium]